MMPTPRMENAEDVPAGEDLPISAAGHVHEPPAHELEATFDPRVIADAKSDRLLGLHILGPRASDMIAEAALAIEFSASAEDVARTCHAHPTLPEAVQEAALALGRAIHI